MIAGTASTNAVISTFTKEETTALCWQFLVLHSGMLKETKKNGVTILTTTPYFTDLSGSSNLSSLKTDPELRLSLRILRLARITKQPKQRKG